MTRERQITTAAQNHIISNTAVWSPDGEWIVYDIRSDRLGAQSDGNRIERAHVNSGRVELLCESCHGACCGVATASPVDDRIVIILGPEHPSPDWQYAPHYRRGAIVDPREPAVAINLDARELTPPFLPGALRGGTPFTEVPGEGVNQPKSRL